MHENIIEIRNLSFSYPDGTGALDNISLEIFKDETIGIIGPNGAGKSTFLLHLNGILRGKGSINISGFGMEGKNLSSIRKRVGIVFQDPDNQLFMPTVFDDVSFGPVNMGFSAEETKARVKEALHEVEMPDCAGRPSHHLSFGEKKRVSIATVLSMDPEILALDEPTGNLDPRSRGHLIELLKNIKKTKIIASHDLEMVADICDRVLILDKGRVAAAGPAKEVLSDKPLLQRHGLS